MHGIYLSIVKLYVYIYIYTYYILYINSIFNSMYVSTMHLEFHAMQILTSAIWHGKTCFQLNTNLVISKTASSICGIPTSTLWSQRMG